MKCKHCKGEFSEIRDYNQHILHCNCNNTSSNYYEEEDHEIVYTKSGEPIRAEDDISEFLNQDDDDYVPGSCD